MLMIAGFIFLAAGLYRGIIIYTQMMKRPKVQAEIVSKEKKTGFPPFKNKEHTFARVKYQFQEHSFDNEEIAMKIDAEIGAQIECYLDPNNPKDIEQYAPKKDLIPVLAVLTIGAGLVIFSFWAIAALDS